MEKMDKTLAIVRRQLHPADSKKYISGKHCFISQPLQLWLGHVSWERFSYHNTSVRSGLSKVQKRINTQTTASDF